MFTYSLLKKVFKIYKCKILLVFSSFLQITLDIFKIQQICVMILQKKKKKVNYLFTLDVPCAELCLSDYLLLCCRFCCSELFTGSFHLHATQMQAV